MNPKRRSKSLKESTVITLYTKMARIDIDIIDKKTSKSPIIYACTRGGSRIRVVAIQQRMGR